MTNEQQPAPRAPRSSLVDGEWHRLHPLTPLLKGGLTLLVVIGIVVANLRERLIDWIVQPLLPDGADLSNPGDPVDFVVANDLILVALGGVLVVLLVLIGLFTLSWRFHTFRITGSEVEVRSGVIFRTHRRAPLDRVQAVNLTRPLVARIVGLAKLEVVGGGSGANVPLEYLSTRVAEDVRGDILRLASGARGERAATIDASGEPGSRIARAADAVSDGITDLFMGESDEGLEQASIVRIPPWRVLGAHVLSGSTIVLLFVIAAVVVGAITTTPWVLFTVIPIALASVAVLVRRTSRALRYSIAPTPHGTRISFGLFTTVTEILPPGRVFAAQVTQPLLWRPVGWFRISVNRISGKSASSSSGEDATSAVVLPVGTRADVERVLSILVPQVIARDASAIMAAGFGASTESSPETAAPFSTTPKRARIFELLSWRRNGVALHPAALLLRRGWMWRTLAIFPLARLQSIAVHQGPLARAFDVVTVVAHTVAGTVSGGVSNLDRDEALRFWSAAEAGAIEAAASDRSHRWAGSAEAQPVPASAPAPAATAAPSTDAPA